MKRNVKEELVSEYKGIFSDAAAGILVDYNGLTVEELTTLRKSLMEKGSRFRVMKNTLAKIAAAGTPYEALVDDFTSTRAFVYNAEDVVAPAKVITEAVKGNEKLKLIGGVLATGDKGELLDATGVKDLGNLPSKEELVAKLMYVLNAPITNFVRTLNEVPASFVRALQAVADKKES